ncbi:olfactory receptor 4S1-like [Esox lucius]|uniref:olfactory receptor 4S1-like n=1 Tax=Esox lucius TaxID=8010 RepID=UPI001476A4F8|nr:olfactory receptor 4S1-like [Esox lucius]
MTSQFNSSLEIVFVLHGLNLTQTNRHIYFVFILILYLFTIFINLTLILTIVLEKMLRDPMYLFLCNLCINGIIGASSFYPKILYDILFDSHVITYIGCLTQILVMYFYVYCEFTNLTVMAYDRYVAICKPLHYHSIMTVRKVWTLILLTWLFSLLEVTIGIVPTVRLPLCGVDIDKLYCSNWAVVQLSCVDTTGNNISGFIFTCSHFFQALLILISYVNIIKASLRSRADRRKFMQTCLPHIITLTNFVISQLFDLMYARYGSNTSLLALRNIMSVEFLVVPPLVNPIIYGIKLTQIQNRVRQMFYIKVAVVRLR